MQLIDRYPDIGFYLATSPFEPFELFLQGREWNARRGAFYLHAHASQEVDHFLSVLSLEETDVLYVYGLGLGYHYEALKKWLHAKKERSLVFIEHDLGVIDAFLKGGVAKTFLSDPQAYLYFLDSQNLEQKIEELALQFPAEKISVVAIASYVSSTFYRLRLKLLRSSAAIYALFADALHASYLFPNLLSNVRRLPRAFDANALEGCFSGVPAILCGAGPSLSAAIDTLKTLKERALIIAGGSAISALSSHGIHPHLAMAFDPNPEEFERLKGHTAQEVPLIYGNRLFAKVFSTFKGEIGYLRSDTGGPFETWMEEKLGMQGKPIGPDLGKEALSVTTLAVAYAHALGCNPLILCGIDLAYTDKQRYAPGVMKEASLSIKAAKKEGRTLEKLLRRKDREGKWVYTTVKWVMESSAIGKYAKEHPERIFFNCTEGGIGFPHIPYKPLKEVASTYCTKNLSLKARLQKEIAARHFTLAPSQLEKHLHVLRESVQRLSTMCDAYLEEIARAKEHPTGKMVLIESDFQEEVAYIALLQLIPPALDKLLQRYYQKGGSYQEKLRAKWEEIRAAVHTFSHILSTYCEECEY